MQRLAVISDIHGNRWALEAVLESIRRAEVSEIVNLGDALYGPLDPAGSAEILVETKFPTVRGNQDRTIIDIGAPASDTLLFVRDELDGRHFDWLRSLQPTLVLESAFLCHATPDSDTDYLVWSVGASGARLRTSEEVASSLATVAQPLILCGHDHVPRTMQLPDGRMVVNPGSVGLPAYADDQPHRHVMETGAPHAHYALATQTPDGWAVHDCAVPYRWQAAVEAALRNGRPDWAKWLQTGRA
jgi:predicted phosphodiesterase